MTGFNSKRDAAADKLQEPAQLTEKEKISREMTAEIAAARALAQPAQKPVGYEHHEYRPFGAPGEIRIHAILASQYMMPDGSVAGDFQFLADAYKADKNTIKLVPLYTASPPRPWVGLTDEDCKGMNAGDKVVAMWANRILKEKNT